MKQKKIIKIKKKQAVAAKFEEIKQNQESKSQTMLERHQIMIGRGGGGTSGLYMIPLGDRFCFFRDIKPSALMPFNKSWVATRDYAIVITV